MIKCFFLTVASRVIGAHLRSMGALLACLARSDAVHEGFAEISANVRQALLCKLERKRLASQLD